MNEGHLLADIPFPSKWVTSFNVHLRIFSLLCKSYIITIVFLTSNFFGGWTHCNIVAEELSAGSGGKITQKWNFIFTKKKYPFFPREILRHCETQLTVWAKMKKNSIQIGIYKCHFLKYIWSSVQIHFCSLREERQDQIEMPKENEMDIVYYTLDLIGNGNRKSISNNRRQHLQWVCWHFSFQNIHQQGGVGSHPAPALWQTFYMIWSLI